MRLISFVLFITIFLFTGCAALQLISDKWHNFPPEKKIKICQGVFKAIQPKCEKLVDKGQKYVDLCSSVVDDAIEGCKPMILKEGPLMCDWIEARTKQCRFVSDDSANRELNVQACEHIVSGVSLACQMMIRSKDENIE